jgi:hypothetical protein
MGECYAGSIAGRVKRLRVGDQMIGIIRLEETMEEVRKRGLRGEEAKPELLRLVSIFNYIPSSAREECGRALLKAYERS